MSEPRQGATRCDKVRHELCAKCSEKVQRFIRNRKTGEEDAREV